MGERSPETLPAGRVTVKAYDTPFLLAFIKCRQQVVPAGRGPSCHRTHGTAKVRGWGIEDRLWKTSHARRGSRARPCPASSTACATWPPTSSGASAKPSPASATRPTRPPVPWSPGAPGPWPWCSPPRAGPSPPGCSPTRSSAAWWTASCRSCAAARSSPSCSSPSPSRPGPNSSSTCGRAERTEPWSCRSTRTTRSRRCWSRRAFPRCCSAAPATGSVAGTSTWTTAPARDSRRSTCGPPAADDRPPSPHPSPPPRRGTASTASGRRSRRTG